MSIVRIGLAETKNFSEGYSAIFGKKKESAAKEPAEEAERPEAQVKKAAAKKKKAGKK